MPSPGFYYRFVKTCLFRLILKGTFGLSNNAQLLFMACKSVELYHVAVFLSDFISCASLELHDMGLRLGLHLQVEGDMGFYVNVKGRPYSRLLFRVLQTSISQKV